MSVSLPLQIYRFKESDEKQNAKIYSNLIGFYCLVICCA